jgi:hypothetical protein
LLTACTNNKKKIGRAANSKQTFIDALAATLEIPPNT